MGHLGLLAMVKNGKHVSKGSELGTPRLIPHGKDYEHLQVLHGFGGI